MVRCQGRRGKAQLKYDYEGVRECKAASMLAGGPLTCAYGCLGFGDCETVCEFDAITMDRHLLPVVDADKCTACGDCVDICPRDLFSLHPVSHRLWVACNNPESGAAAEADCIVLCTGCGRCAADAPEGLISMQQNLAVIDYSRNALASPLAVERCPTGAIVWLEGSSSIYKGSQAVRIVRKEALPVGAPQTRV